MPFMDARIRAIDALDGQPLRRGERAAAAGHADPTVLRVVLRVSRLDIFRAVAEDLLGFHLDGALVGGEHSAIDAKATAPLRIEHEDAEGSTR